MLVLAWLLASAVPVSLPEGDWGGTGVSMAVTASGAKVEFDCAHGSIDEPVVLDASGRFDAKGRFVREKPGPARIGEESDPGVPARYVGQRDGDDLTLRVRVEGREGDFGPFRLKRGSAGLLRKCG